MYSKFIKRFIHNLKSALDAVIMNKVRSILTALGVIFGVSAVITMLAIGSGARQEILQQMEMIGINNIVIDAHFEQQEEESEQEKTAIQRKRFSPGLNLYDAETIQKILPNVNRVSPEVIYDVHAIAEGNRVSARLIGVTPDFFEINNLYLEKGRMFNDYHISHGRPVCIIGRDVQTRVFGNKDPVGESIKCGNIWFEVIGVLKPTYISASAIEDLGLRDYNKDIYVPVRSVLMRYRDRSSVNSGLVSARHLTGGANDEERTAKARNYHQLDRLTVQLASSEYLRPTAEVINRMLDRRHNRVKDFNITIPELLLKQEQRTRDIFNFVLGAIAGISLLVGGIGIMNIMLASVLERIREIGIRKSVGATRRDIIMQFLSEAVLISVSGGFIGIALGVGMSLLVDSVAGITTIVTLPAILLSFGVSVTIGLVFGILPARKAAKMDPVESLRYE